MIRLNKFGIFAAAAVFINSGMAAFAAPEAIVTVEDSYVRVEVAGSIVSGAADEVVDFYIAAADTEEGQDDFIHADQKNTGDGGSYCFKARINPDLGGGTLRYTVKAAGAEAETGEISIVDMGRSLALADIIKSATSVSEIESAFEGYDPCLGMPVYDDISKGDIYSGLFEHRAEITGTRKLFEELKSLTVLAGLKQGSQAMLQDGSLMYMDIIGVDGDTAASYNTQLSDKGRANVNQYILKASCGDLENYAAELKKLVYTNLLTNNKTVNYDEAEKIIQSFGDMIGINVAEYNKLSRKNDVKMAVLNSGAANPEELRTAYEKAVKNFGGGSSGGNSGGGSGGSGGGSSASANVGGYIPSSAGDVQAREGEDGSAVSGFSDMVNYGWAETAVAGLKAKNVMSGKGGDIFAPQDNITREEFVKAIMSAFSLMPENTDETGSAKFSDVDPEEWYAPFIAQAEKIGVVQGIGDYVFGIGTEVTRQDMAAIAFRAIRYTKAQLDSDTDTDGFYDQEAVDDYAADGIKIFKKMGLLNGYPDGTFRPGEFTVRAEAAQFIWNLINLIEG